MKIKIQPLHKDFVLPSYAKDGDAGLDLTAVARVDTVTYTLYQTGFAIDIPPGFMGLIFPRSSVSKLDLLMANSVGVIDSGYKDEVQVRFKRLNENDDVWNYKKSYVVGDRIAQLIIIPVPKVELVVVDTLDKTNDRGGGFGSTDKIKLTI